MQFTRVRATDKGVTIEWHTPVEKRPDSNIDSVLKSKEAPHPDFLAALQALKPDVVKLLELPASYGKAITVTGIRLTHVKGKRGVVISCQRKIEGCNSPFNLHTPHMTEASDEDANSTWLSDELLALLDTVEARAKEYIEGVRAQAELALVGAGR